MVDTLEKLHINILFCMGGDGTLRCANASGKKWRGANCLFPLLDSENH
jgi:6-phosphofructokinase